jgi:replicative DNA helicase
MSSTNGVLPEFDILNFLDKLEITKELPREYHCQCPACGDGGFKIDKTTGKYSAFKCECSNQQIREAIRPLKAAFEEHVPAKPIRPKSERKWEYRSRDGKPLVAVKRTDDGKGNRKIMQGHWDGNKYKPGCPKELRAEIPIYRYSDVQKAIADSEPFVFWVEGEPCADALWDIGIPATTTIGGCEGLGRYGSYENDLAGIKVVLCPDMDAAGLKYAMKVQRLYPDSLWCYPYPESGWWDKLPEKAGLDIADWIADGANRESVLAGIGEQRQPKQVDEDFEAKAIALESLVHQYTAEQSPIKKALLKTRILKEYGIGRTELKELEAEYASVPEFRIRHISDPSTEHELSLLQVIEQKSLGEIERGIPTGFVDLDSIVQGLQRKRLYLVAGRPSDGKSALTENIALNIAKTNHKAGKKNPIVIFTPEMTNDEWKERALSIETSIDSHRISSGRIADHEWLKLVEHYEFIDELPIFTDDSTGIGVKYIEQCCEWITETHGLPSLVVIDYLSLIKPSTASGNRVQEVSQIARELQEAAKRINAPLFVLSQLSRALTGRNDKRPILSDLRESGELEQVADVVMMLYRDEEHNPDTMDRGITEVIVRKNRQGPKATAKLLFEPQYTRFRNLAQQS